MVFGVCKLHGWVYFYNQYCTSNYIDARGILKKVDVMETAIIEAIAVNSQFGKDEVKEAFDLYKSYDLIVSACEFASVMGYSNLVTACKKLQYG